MAELNMSNSICPEATKYFNTHLISVGATPSRMMCVKSCGIGLKISQVASTVYSIGGFEG